MMMKDNNLRTRWLSWLLMIIIAMSIYTMPVTVIAVEPDFLGDDGTTNWDFIVPVTHKKTVPNGYIIISLIP